MKSKHDRRAASWPEPLRFAHYRFPRSPSLLHRPCLGLPRAADRGLGLFGAGNRS